MGRRTTMDDLARFLNWLRRPGSRTPGVNPETRSVEDILQGEVQRLRKVDPDTAQQWRHLQVALQIDESAVKVRPLVGGLRPPRLAIASAVAVVVLVVAGIVWLRQPGTMLAYETGRGQISTITLADSSEVTLNHTSELILDRQPFEKARHVRLNGEAYFRIRKSGVPFIVTTDVATIQVLGTEFNVRMREEQIEVAVLAGRVQVGVHKEGKDSTVVLSAGQVATCAHGEFPGAPAQLLFAEYPGWMHGKLLFYIASLLSACNDIESKFDVPVRIENARLRDKTLTGAVDARSAETALSTLANLTGNKYRYENGGYILY
jgi:transmembrane sensor